MSFQFGKYTNKMYDEVYEFDPSYMRWLLTQELILEKNQDLRDYLNSKFKDTDTSYQINFGKYKGKTINQIIKLDKQYLEWLLKNSQFDNMTTLKAEIKKILI